MDSSNNSRVTLTAEDRVRLLVGDAVMRAVIAETKVVELASKITEQEKELVLLRQKLTESVST